MRFTVFTLLSILWFPTGSIAQTWEVTSIPQKIVNGSPILFNVNSSTQLKSLEGEWLGRHVYFNFDDKSGGWVGLAGVSLKEKAGTYPLSLTAVPSDGASFPLTHLVTIEQKEYPEEHLIIHEDEKKPKKRIERETKLKEEKFKTVSLDHHWSLPFVAPIKSEITSVFGIRRTMNGNTIDPHAGLDFRAKEGTVVGAMNDGKVILVGDLYYEGGFVVIDHGQGLLSLYLHLSKVYVEEGEYVKKKKILALSGKKGRVTDAHLDVRIRWQGIYIDPEILLNM